MSFVADVETGLTGAGARRLVEGRDRVVVVGAGGWLGLASLELLHRLLGGAAFEARVVAFGSQARTLRLRGGLNVDQRPMAELRALPTAPTLLLHFAFLTQEKAKAMSEIDYVDANTAISRQVLEALDPIGATGVFVPSSGAVYLADNPESSASMRLYGRLKLADETAFSAWASRGARRAVIARVFNLSGPYINKQSSYALACFIADAVAGRPIQIKATRPVFRSYVAISELVSAALVGLTDGGHGPILFDTAGEREYEMAELAEAIRLVVNLGVTVERPEQRTGEPDRYVGDGMAYAELRRAGGVKAVGFEGQIVETARFMAGADLAGQTT